MKLLINCVLILGLFFALIFTACNRKKHQNAAVTYTCPMHPQIKKDASGECPVCHMPLVPMNQNAEEYNQDEHALGVKDLAQIPVIQLQTTNFVSHIEALGNVAYDTQQIGSISSNIEGRIEKLYIKYPFQKVSKGQKIMEIYSPELQTAQQNLLFLLKNDTQNFPLINSAKEKLRLLGVSASVLQGIINNQKLMNSIPVYSTVSGYVKDFSMLQSTESTSAKTLSIKEGMYVKKGETLFGVYNTAKTWALLSVYNKDARFVTKGLAVELFSELRPAQVVTSKVNFIEPFFRENQKTMTVRANFDNSKWSLPIGSAVKAKIYFNSENLHFLPKSAVVSLGYSNVVYVKQSTKFVPQNVQTGLEYENMIQIVSGLKLTDSVAVSAQYFQDNESFIKTNQLQ